MSAEIFRDRSEGANARRLDLLRRRRDELITMPHAVRRVFVSRSARIAASLTVCIGGVLLLAAAAIPTFYAFLERVLPGVSAAPLSEILLATWIATFFVYALAQSRGEHRFIVQMSRYVLPGDDLDHDIERLSHEHPDAMAKAMAQKLEVRSAAWPVVAAAFLVPATIGYVTDSILAGHWSRQYEYHLAAQLVWLLGLGVAGTLVGAVMTRTFARRPIVAPIAALVGMLGALALPFVIRVENLAPLWLGAIIGVTFAIAIVVWRLRVERARIDATDPTAGSELFTLKDALAMLRTARTKLRPAMIPAIAFGVLFLVAGSPLMASNPTPAQAAPIAVSLPKTATPVAAAATPATPVRHDTRSVALANGRSTEIRGIAGFDTLPQGWTMTVIVHVDNAPGLMTVNPFNGTSEVGYENGTLVSKLHISACSGPVPLGIRLDREANWEPSNALEVSIEPKLAYDCRDK
jgi:hypothetical protein